MVVIGALCLAITKLAVDNPSTELLDTAPRPLSQGLPLKDVASLFSLLKSNLTKYMYIGLQIESEAKQL